jgi:hypothetical protein
MAKLHLFDAEAAAAPFRKKIWPNCFFYSKEWKLNVDKAIRKL